MRKSMIEWTKLDAHKFLDENVAANALLPRIALDSPSERIIAEQAEQGQPFIQLF